MEGWIRPMGLVFATCAVELSIKWLIQDISYDSGLTKIWSCPSCWKTVLLGEMLGFEKMSGDVGGHARKDLV